jgi:hypothetical protein
MGAKEKKEKKGQEKFKLPFGKKNYLLFGSGIFVIIVGYIFLGQGSITIAPILLVLGYCVIIPISIIVRDKKEEKSEKPIS